MNFLKFTLSIIFLALHLQINAQEICDNRIDDDGDGLIDCLDPDCSNATTCWDCITEFYQVHSNTTLVSLDPVTGNYTTLGTISGATQINGAQFNQIDGHVYAPSIINGVNKLGMLSPNGQVTDTGLTLPGSNMFYAGAIDANGKMYISNSSGIHSIDLNAATLSVVNTGVAHPGVADFSLDITNGFFYGIASGGTLKVFNPANSSVSSYNLAGSIVNESGAFGAAWSCNNGAFFAYNNSSGKIYSVDVNNLTATEVLNGTGNLSINDGFNCVLSNPPFESNCGDGVDEDGDGLVDCNDPDCYNSNQCTVEICNNGIDDDNDGWIDCSDSECFSLTTCLEICDNGIDDNGNGLIDGNDPQCGTSGGVNGGMESNRRLSQKIAQRNFETIVKNGEEYYEKLEGVLPYQSNMTRNGFDIKTFIPVDIFEAYVAESTPVDLIGVTNAIDVAAADYYVNNQRIASVLGIHSEEGVYEHTKYICDRLDGSRLIDISYLFARGGNFISYELINKNGQREYAVSFSASYHDQIGFTVENHWNLHKYDADKNYYNYQIWSNSYQNLIALLERTLDNMMQTAPIDEILYSEIPAVFVTYGEYENGKLTLSLKNKNRTEEVKFQGALSRVEGGELENFEFDVQLTGASEERVVIETGYLYDLGASISSENNPDDAIFLADGAWGIDTQNPNAEVLDFSIESEQSEFSADAYQIERSVELSANVKDYLNVYRALDAKLNAKDLRGFSNLSFTASGKGDVEVTIVKASIEEWGKQFRTYITLNENEEQFNLNIGDFKSNVFEGLELNDVTMIVFTVLGNNNTFEQKTMQLSQLQFDYTIISNTSEIVAATSNIISPNPVLDLANLTYNSNEDTPSEIEIFDNLGRLVFQKTIQSFKGENQIKIDLSQLKEGIYFLQVNSAKGLIAKEKLIKSSN